MLSCASAHPSALRAARGSRPRIAQETGGERAAVPRQEAISITGSAQHSTVARNLLQYGDNTKVRKVQRVSASRNIKLDTGLRERGVYST